MTHERTTAEITDLGTSKQERKKERKKKKERSSSSCVGVWRGCGHCGVCGACVCVCVVTAAQRGVWVHVGYPDFLDFFGLPLLSTLLGTWKLKLLNLNLYQCYCIRRSLGLLRVERPRPRAVMAMVASRGVFAGIGGSSVFLHFAFAFFSLSPSIGVLGSRSSAPSSTPWPATTH